MWGKREEKYRLTPEEELSFEEALARLEQVVRSLEQGELGLEESLRLYEMGTQLVALCTRRLDEAEGRLARLQTGEDGEVVQVPWDPQP